MPAKSPAGVVVATAMMAFHPGAGTSSTARTAGTAMRCREAGSGQRECGHEDREEFPVVVRFITILFPPLWAYECVGGMTK